MTILQRLVRMWFNWRLSAKKIHRHCARMQITNCSAKAESTPRKVKVSCIQRKIQTVNNVKDYIDMLDNFVKEAAHQHSQLVVFPEYNFLDLLGVIPGFNLLNRYINRKVQRVSKSRPSQGDEESGELISPDWIFKAISKPIEKGIEAIFAHLARGYGIYIYTGSYLTMKEGILYNIGSLFAPDGELIGRQEKMHLTELEASFAMGRGVCVQTYELPIGRIAFPICMDATYFETFRILRELGVDIVILPIANPEEYNPWKALKGVWPRVQESYVIGLKASLNGWFAGIHYTGKAGIFAPIPMTPENDGILHITSYHEGDQVVTGEVDLTQLEAVREEAEYHGDHNLEFEKNYVTKTYFNRR